MNPILKKLGLKDENPILVLNAPEEYQPVMAEIEAQIDTQPRGKYEFVQLFATEMAQAHHFA